MLTPAAPNDLWYLYRLPCQGRLTTESGVAVSTSDRTAQGTLYFTPFRGNLVGLYDGSGWQLLTFNEISLSLAGITSGKNYDVFIYSNSGTPTLELSAAWTNDTTRANALALQDGIWVKSGLATRRWLGTIRASAANVTEDSEARRFVWNICHQVPRSLRKTETTTSWTYSTGSYRQANGSGANQVEIVIGDAALLELQATHTHKGDAAGEGAYLAIGEDSTSTPDGSNAPFQLWVTTAGQIESGNSTLSKHPAIGYHYYAWLERGTSNSTFFGYYANLRSNGLRGFVVG